MSRIPRGLATGAAATAVVLGAAAIFQQHPEVVQADPATPAARNEQALERAQDLSTAFEFVAQSIRPSVVSIRSARRVQRGQGPADNAPYRDFGDDFFERFFGPPGGRRDFEARGLGTGVIVSADGYILTNNHVVDQADEVRVQLGDERTFTAKVVGTDPKTDLAVLRIDAQDLQPARLGDSEGLKVGEWVVAAGNPFGLTASISAGIVSAKGRSDVRIAEYEDFIQTDAAINPGNSGGPLVNLRGQVVGINTAIYSRSGGYMGIGFAIPVNMAKAIMTSLIQDGRVVRGWLGVQIQDLDADLAASFGYKSTGGVLVTDVMASSPAATAKMQREDIIVSFDGKTTANVAALRALVAATKPGTSAPMEVFREGRTRTLHLEVGEQEQGEREQPRAEPVSLDLGLAVRTLTTDLARRAGYDQDIEGVLVTAVEPLSPASRAGVQENDVIVSVQGRSIDSVAAFDTGLAKADLAQGVRLGLRRGNARQFVVLKGDGKEHGG